MSYFAGLFDDVTGGSSSTAPSSSVSSTPKIAEDKSTALVYMIGAAVLAYMFWPTGSRTRTLFTLLMLCLSVAACSISACTNVNTGPKAKAIASTTVADTAPPLPQTHNFLFGVDTVNVSVKLATTPQVDTITIIDTTFLHDTIIVTPPASGVDTTTTGDTTRFVYWHLGKIVDSTRVVVKPPTTKGRPYGPTALFDATTYAPFTGSAGENSIPPSSLIKNLNEARSKKVKMTANLPCGSHSASNLGNCLVLKNGVAVFSRQRFDSALATYNTSATKAALDSAYKDGTLIGVQLMDEPWVKGGGDGNTWGPNGLTRAQADSSCATAKAGAFKNVPVGVSDASPKMWPSTTVFKSCDFGLAQFSYRFGTLASWRDTMLTLGTTGHYQTVFQFNIVNGGTQDTDATWNCPGTVKGSRAPNCTMTGPQVVGASLALGNSGCGILGMWRWDQSRFALPALVSAFKTVADTQATRVPNICKVRP